MAQSIENIQLSLGQKWLNEYCGSIEGYIPVPESGAYDTVGQTIIAILTAIQKNIGISNSAISSEYAKNSHIFGDETKQLLGECSLSANTDFSNDYNLNMLKALQLGMWCKGINPGSFGVFSGQTTAAINELMSRAGINASDLDGCADMMVFRSISTEISFEIPYGLNGVQRVREIQLMINGAYAKERQYLIPCDGIKAMSTIAGFLYYYQRTVGLSAQEAKNAYGLYNTETYNLSPILEEGSANTEMITILQDSLYLNNGYDIETTGVFGEETQSVVEQLQLAVGLPMSGIVDKLTWGYVLESCGYQNIPPTVCDTSMVLGPNEIEILKENNITMVGRYLTAEFAMTKDELVELIESNIAVIPLFEYGNSVSYFTFEQGQKDALDAVLAAEKLGILADNSVTIYFAVDTDISLGDLESNITDYFNGIFTKIVDARLGYNIGVYGARYTCTYLLEKGYVSNSYVASSSYEFKLNMGYPMPSKWGFNQYSTMNINSNGTASGILLGGVIPIDKVTRSGYDSGITKILENGKIISISSKNNITHENLKEINEKNFEKMAKLASTILSGMLNIKTDSILSYLVSKDVRDGLRERFTIPLPGTEGAMYLRGAFGLKGQAGGGSLDTIYLNKGESKFSLSPTIDILPVNIFGGTAGVNLNCKYINPKVLDEASNSEVIQSLIPTFSKTYINSTDWSLGVQYYPCWAGNEDAEKGYYETGMEIGINFLNGTTPFTDTPVSLYFYIDIILGIRIIEIKELFEGFKEELESVAEGIIKYLTNVLDEVKISPKIFDVAAEGDETELIFTEKVPSILTKYGKFIEDANEDTWEVVVDTLESPIFDDAALAALCLA